MRGSTQQDKERREQQLDIYEAPAFGIGIAISLIEDTLDNQAMARESLPKAIGYLREAQRRAAELTGYPYNRE